MDGCSYVTSAHGPEYYYDFHHRIPVLRCPHPGRREQRFPGRPLPRRPPPTATNRRPRRPPKGRKKSEPAPGGTPTESAPKGYRSFKNAAGKLPAVGSPPAYEPADAACPVDMQLVEGNRCPHGRSKPASTGSMSPARPEAAPAANSKSRPHAAENHARCATASTGTEFTPEKLLAAARPRFVDGSPIHVQAARQATLP